MSDDEPKEMRRIHLRPDNLERDERTLSSIPMPTMGIPRDIQAHAEAFAEYRFRSGYRPFHTRQLFDHLTNTAVIEHLDEAKKRIAERYGLEPI